MLPLQRLEARIRVVNEALIPLARGVKRYASLWLQLRRVSSKPLQLITTRDYTVTLLVAELPASRPLLVAFYVSMQTRRPISPSQLAQRLSRIAKEVGKLRGKLIAAADTLYIVYSPRGFTRGARWKARREGVNLAKSVREAMAPIARYISKRFNKLIESLKGKKVWGNLPILVYALQELGLSIGAEVQRVLGPPQVIELAEKGGIITKQPNNSYNY